MKKDHFDGLVNSWSKTPESPSETWTSERDEYSSKKPRNIWLHRTPSGLIYTVHCRQVLFKSRL